MKANNALEWTVNHGGRTVRACMGARAGAEERSWPAIQRNRQVALPSEGQWNHRDLGFGLRSRAV